MVTTHESVSLRAGDS